MSRAGTISPPTPSPALPAVPSMKDAAARRFDWKSKRTSTVPTELLEIHNGETKNARRKRTFCFDLSAVILEETGHRRRRTTPSRFRFAILRRATPSRSSSPFRSVEVRVFPKNWRICRRRRAARSAAPSRRPIPIAAAPRRTKRSPRTRNRSRSARLRPEKVCRSNVLLSSPEICAPVEPDASVETTGKSSSSHSVAPDARLLRRFVSIENDALQFPPQADAAGYDYARRVQELSHAIYSYALKATHTSTRRRFPSSRKTNNAFCPFVDRSPISTREFPNFITPTKKRSTNFLDEQVKRISRSSKRFFLQKIFVRRSGFRRCGSRWKHHLPRFGRAGRYSSSRRGEISRRKVDRRKKFRLDFQRVDLNYETWSDLARSRSRSRSRANTTNVDVTRGRSGTTGSTGSGEFVLTSPIQTISFQEPPSDSPPMNVCMMCLDPTNGTAHENEKLGSQKEFIRVKFLASRLLVNIHTEEIERELLGCVEFLPTNRNQSSLLSFQVETTFSGLFDNICLYSEICYLFTLSKVRIGTQRFLHDLFSDCQFQTVSSAKGFHPHPRLSSLVSTSLPTPSERLDRRIGIERESDGRRIIEIFLFLFSFLSTFQQ